MFNCPALTRALCALAVLGCATNASADTRSVSVTSTITGFGWRLIDLNPNDGIAPELTVISKYVSSVSIYDRDGYPLPYDIKDERQGYGSTAVHGLYGEASSDLSATDSRLSASLASDASAYAYAAASSDVTLRFSLTPHTGVLFNAAAAVDPAASNTATTELAAQATLRGWLDTGATFYSEFDDSFILRTDIDDPADLGSSAYHLSGLLYSGAEAATARVDFNNYARATLDGPTAPVPEPESYAMLLVGLGLVGARAAACRAVSQRDA
ncbi:PEP-CTERM sorting domain-containing protein [Massilia genomosp. 1]|uniref:PEP-CTERM sorting domain-containing protein n=1 Tax=Massilia genomosp. 1 TaxID=2609280 RepID=UPI001C9E1F70